MSSHSLSRLQTLDMFTILSEYVTLTSTSKITNTITHLCVSIYIVILRIVMNDLKSYPYVTYFNMGLIKYKYIASNTQYHLQGIRDFQKSKIGRHHTHD